MSLATDAIAALDSALSASGETIRLRRLTGSQGIAFEVDCPATVRGYRPDELVDGVTQQDRLVIISPTEIDRHGWPGPNSSTTPTAEDRRVPRKGDFAIVDGRSCTVQAGTGLRVAGVLVRIELQVRG